MSETDQEYYKEGQLNGQVSTIITLVVGVGAAVLVLIFVGTLGGRMYQITEPDIDAISTYAVSGEAFTALNSTAVALTNQPIHSGTLIVTNGSDNVGLGNFTINYETGSLTLLNNNYNNTELNAAYNWGNTTIQGSIKRGIISGFNALEDTGNYLPLIVTAFVIVIVVGLILGTLAMYGKGGNNNNFSAL